MVQWLGLCAFTAEGLGSIPGRRTKIPQVEQQGQKKRKFVSSYISQNEFPESQHVKISSVTALDPSG